MRRSFTPAAVATLFILRAVPCAAQYIAPAGVSRATMQTPDTLPAPRQNTPGEEREISVVGGVVGGSVGLVVGALAGTAIGVGTANGCRGELCGLGPAVIGFLIGESVGLAAGTHVGSRSPRHERMILTTFTSLGIAAVGIASAAGVSSHGGGAPILVAIPLLQLWAAVAIEAH